MLLVSDTSILIDLERGGLLATAFAAGMPMVVPDILYQREIAEYNGPYLRELGLQVVELTPAEVQLAQEVNQARPTLSLTDCFALSCATRAGHILVTGDRALRTEATSRQVEVVGLLWLLDRLAEVGVDLPTLRAGLDQIANHPRCRVPSGEVRARLAAWDS
ncbi:hypothetical protein [Ramlibacter sp. WS9]|uniref:hypothetical protein n=1 Tax=Ramlibacter sp. WS9 TaxID=1882741 RepID=UPI001143B8A8|nr:hypothetical protein [Ramlibacter sp. WS9]ROZ74933.1 hypothetical protein EEB15_16245 [Ramlibacter sp. WS9]